MPAFAKGHKANFQTILAAASAGHLALLDCADAKTGKPVATIVAINREPSGQFGFVPLARMFDGNPFEELSPPNPDGGYLDNH